MNDSIRKGEFQSYVDHIADRRSLAKPENMAVRQEIKLACVQCMLMLFDRKERIVFILGAVFKVTDVIGSEICGISRDNFRKILSRSRQKMHNFFSTQCSLVNENNPCRCGNHLDIMIQMNIIRPDDLLVLKQNYGTIKSVSKDSIQDLEDSYYEFNLLFGDQPFLKAPDMTRWLKELVNNKDDLSMFNIALS